MKNIKLQILKDKVLTCEKCPDLCLSRTKPVFSSGNPNSKIFIIGHSPGETEDQKGIPFIGKAGKLLNNILKACNIARDNVYVTNTVLCHPKNNRDPLPEEIYNCKIYLKLQLEIVKPKYIVCLGALAAQSLLEVTDNISSLRGRFFDYNNIKVLATYHPSYALRGNKEEQSNKKLKIWEDFQFLLEDMVK